MDARSGDGRLVVVNGNWEDATLAAILDVLESVQSVLTGAFRTLPDAPIHVSPWTQAPLTVFDRRPHEVWLSASSRYWSQYAYQFAHELCHILTGHDRYRKHRHRWFDESVCELASLFALYRLAETWRTDPPSRVPGAGEFARHHREYADARRAKHRLPETERLPEWFAAHGAVLESGDERRDLYTTVADALLDDFLADPGLWQDVGQLNRWNPQTDASFADYLDSWERCIVEAGRAGRAPHVVRCCLGVGTA